MKVGGWVCGSCAAIGIEGLGTHKDPIDAMLAFCRGAGVRKVKPWGKTIEEGEYPKAIESHVIFVAGPEKAVGEKGSSHHSKKWVKYGTEFARYIRANKLGKVATVSKVLNHKYHKTTTCQVWIWQPDLKALIAWWEARIAEGLIDVNGRKQGPIEPLDTCNNCQYYYKNHTDNKCPYSIGTVWG